MTRTTSAPLPPSMTRNGRYTWGATLLLCLLPGALTTVYGAVLGPLAVRAGLPADAAMLVNPVILGLELGFLLHLVRRRTGGRRLADIRQVVDFRNRLPWWQVLGVAAGLFVTIAGLNAVLSPVADVLKAHLPDWGPAGKDALGQLPVAMVAVYFALTYLMNGLLEPIVEELYFRGHLLSRLPVAGTRAVLLNAGLFSVSHFWQPELYPLVFLAQVLVMLVLVRLRDMRVPIVVHCAINCTGTTLALVAYLGG